MKHSARLLTLSAVVVLLVLVAGCGETGALHRIGAGRFGVGYDVAVADGHAYVTGNDGVVVFAVDNPRRPRKVARLEAGFTGGALVQDGLVFVASENGLLIADVADPGEPIPLGSYRTSGVALSVSVNGNLAYIASDWGLEIIDVSIPSLPLMVGGLGGLGGARSVVVRETNVYLATPDRGVRIIDVTDPSSPRSLSTVRDTGGAWDLHLHEELLTVGCHGGGVRVLSLADPLAPRMVIRLPEDDDGEAQGVWYDGERLVVADNYSVELFDLSDPSAPLEIGRYQYPRGALHDLDVVGDFVYVAGGTEGLIILHIQGDATD